MDLRLALMYGLDLPIPECQLVIHQPTLREIAQVGETDFFTGIQYLSLSKTMFMDESLLANATNFEIFMTIMSEEEGKEKKKAVQQVLFLLFPNKNVFFTPRALVVSDNEGSVTIDNSNFESLQQIIRDICCANTGPSDQQSFNPADKKAKEIADKLMRGRQRVAAQKGTANSSVLTQYSSVLTVGLNSMSLKDIEELTIYQLYDLIERYMLRVNWEIDIQCRMSGGKPDSQADNWMKNLH